MTRYERLLAAIYSGIEHPEDWIDALDLLARASGSRAAGLFVVEAGQVSFDVDSGMPESFMRGFRQRAAQDPRLHYAATRPRGEVINDDLPQLQPAIEAAGLPAIKREFDLQHTAAVLVDGSGERLPTLYLSRSRRQGPLLGNGSGWLRSLAPHFGRALRLRRMLHPGSAGSRPLPRGLLGERRLAKAAETLPAQLRRVLLALSAGASTADIAMQLGVSINTVRTHVSRLLALSGTHRRTALLREAERRGWLRR